MSTKGVLGEVILDANNLHDGYKAECPFCHTVCEARYDEWGDLVWHKDARNIGVWCDHANGCYEGGRTVQFLFS